jgi:hemoglobin-like flavoprotein
MLDKALEMVRMEQLDENMGRLGKMHVTYGVKAEYFPMMGEALFHMLKELLKDDFDDASEGAWAIVYARLSKQMVAAMNSETVVLESWGKLKEITNYQEVVGTILFQR